MISCLNWFRFAHLQLEAASAVVQRNLALSAAAEGRPQPQQQADPAPKQEVFEEMTHTHDELLMIDY